MNAIDAVLDAASRWPSESTWRAPAWRRGGLAMGCDRLLDPGAVRQQVDQFMQTPSSVGWVETTDRIVWLLAGQSCPGDAPILNAELAVPDRGDSLHVRQTDEAWLLTRMREETVDELLTDEVQLASADPTRGALQYVRYWLVDPEGRLRLRACRFAGLGSPGKGGET
jgi:hypothetical protein